MVGLASCDGGISNASPDASIARVDAGATPSLADRSARRALAVFWGFLSRAGFRADEAAGLTMKDVDVERGIITLDENKMNDPRTPTFGPELMTALKLWKETYRAGAEPDDLFFIRPDGASIPIDGLGGLP